MRRVQQLRNRAALVAAASAIATCVTAPLTFGAVQTYITASGTPGIGADHPGGGFYQLDGAFDAGVAGDFEFAGSDGAFHMDAHSVFGGGVTGRASDTAAYFQMDYNPNPPTTFFGSFWFGGVGNEIGPLPSTTYANVLAYADVIAPAGMLFEIRVESAYTSQGNGFRISAMGTGTWQTVGGALSSAITYGNFNPANTNLTILAAFGNGGNEITTVDDGTNPNIHPTLIVDNFTLTPVASGWTGTGGGNWSDPTKWPTLPGATLATPADGANATATFGSTITAPSTITVDGPRFAGNLQIDSALAYTFAGTGTSSLNIRTVGAGTHGTVSVGLLGSHTISAPLELWNDTTFNIQLAGSSLDVSTLLDVHPGAVVTKAGAGTLLVPNVRSAGLNVTGGTVHVHANGADTGTSKVGALTVVAGATLDLDDNDMVVVGGNVAAIGALVGQARNGGTWNAPGLSSSAARNNGSANTSLGVISGADYTSFGHTGTFSGQTYAAGDALVKYTWNGDTNFSGTVNFDDYVRIDVGFNTNLTGWSNGDFNYSGGVNFDDYVLIDVAFNTQSGTLSRAVDYLSGDNRTSTGLDNPAVQMVLQHFDEFGSPYASAFLAAVPEPVMLPLGLGLAAAATLRRSRRVLR